uniref:Uncharacterized protein n=1 Tax=Chenopodium quinoa TaxID=63459 RepID=A0A803N093_CHEQI
MKKLYRFKEMWLLEDSCSDIIQKAWQKGGNIAVNILNTTDNLTSWKKTMETIAKMRAIDERMDELEEKEELYWRQRSMNLKNSTREATCFGLIINDILDMAKTYSAIKFSHVGRTGNRVPHCLASLSKNLDSLLVWIEEAHIDALNLVMADIISN